METILKLLKVIILQSVAVTDGNLEYIINAYDVLEEQRHGEREQQETFFAKGHAMLTDPFGINGN